MATKRRGNDELESILAGGSLRCARCSHLLVCSIVRKFVDWSRMNALDFTSVACAGRSDAAQVSAALMRGLCIQFAEACPHFQEEVPHAE